MSTHYHAVLWIDHHEARVIYFNADDVDESVIHPAHPPRHLHSKAGSPSGTHLQGDDLYFSDIAEALMPAKEFLVAGPSSAKTEFVKYLHRRPHDVADRLAGIETLENVTDNQLVAEARRFFKAADRMRSQIG